MHIITEVILHLNTGQIGIYPCRNSILTKEKPRLFKVLLALALCSPFCTYFSTEQGPNIRVFAFSRECNGCIEPINHNYSRTRSQSDRPQLFQPTCCRYSSVAECRQQSLFHHYNICFRSGSYNNNFRLLCSYS